MRTMNFLLDHAIASLAITAILLVCAELLWRLDALNIYTCISIYTSGIVGLIYACRWLDTRSAKS